jgi:hypothetical protein
MRLLVAETEIQTDAEIVAEQFVTVGAGTS